LVDRVDDRIQTRPESAQFFLVGADQFIEKFNAVRGQTDVHLTSIVRAWFADDQSLESEAIDQPDCAVVRDLKLFREFSDCRGLAAWKSLDREESLILARSQAGGRGRFLTEM
jgi:hypothetical protein